MSFNDIRRISYDRLVQRVATDKPYKGSGNAYPLGSRNYSNRHFRREEDGTFTIWYADRETVDNKFGRTNDKQTVFENSPSHYANCMLGRVHPDNSFEFTTHTSQGENMLLSEGLYAWVHHDKSKGGTVFEKRRVGGSKYVHPVFKGLRINCETGEAMTPYSVFLPVVKRKAANEVMSKYQEFISVFSAMINSMDDRGIWEVYEDMYKHEAKGDRDMWRRLDMTVVKRLIDEKKYVDAGCLFNMNSRDTSMRWRVEWHMDRDAQSSQQTMYTSWKSHAIKDIDTNFRKMVLKQHPEVFKFTELEQGTPLPSSQWGVDVRVNNQSVSRL